MKEENRFQFLDISRSLAIILMVCGHCDTSNKINYFLGIFNMSVFIFISGYLFKNRTFKDYKDLFNYIVRKVKKLYLFYLEYELLFFVFKNVFFKISFYSEQISYGGKFIQPLELNKEFIIEIFKIIGGMGREPFCGAFWFIITLIFNSI